LRPASDILSRTSRFPSTPTPSRLFVPATLCPSVGISPSTPTTIRQLCPCDILCAAVSVRFHTHSRSGFFPHDFCAVPRGWIPAARGGTWRRYSCRDLSPAGADPREFGSAAFFLTQDVPRRIQSAAGPASGLRIWPGGLATLSGGATGKGSCLSPGVRQPERRAAGRSAVCPCCPMRRAFLPGEGRNRGRKSPTGNAWRRATSRGSVEDTRGMIKGTSNAKPEKRQPMPSSPPVMRRIPEPPAFRRRPWQHALKPFDPMELP
jgi:hypothetical protein